jgi:hypothetical protein
VRDKNGVTKKKKGLRVTAEARSPIDTSKKYIAAMRLARIVRMIWKKR